MKKPLFIIAILASCYLPFNSYAQNSLAPLGAERWYAGNNKDYILDSPTFGPNETWVDHVSALPIHPYKE
jgi:hypothetical protein